MNNQVQVQYVYRQSEPGLYTVGFYDPSGEWIPESDLDKEGAAKRVAWLNGGTVPNEIMPIDSPLKLAAAANSSFKAEIVQK